MATRKIAALLIGQSPRPDLVAPLEALLPADCKVVQLGALDGLSTAGLPVASGAAYPLTTRLANGRLVQVTTNFVEPLMQAQLDRIEDEIVASIVLCAGTFANLRSKRPLVKPFNLAAELLCSLRFDHLGIIAPFPEQEAPIRQRWENVGVQTVVWTADVAKQSPAFDAQLSKQIQTNYLQAIVLDYVGHFPEHVGRLKSVSPVPVFDLGELACTILASMFRRSYQI